MDSQVLMTAQVSRLLGVSTDRLYRAYQTGRLPEPAKSGVHRFYTEADVEAAKTYFAALDARRTIGRKPADVNH